MCIIYANVLIRLTHHTFNLRIFYINYIINWLSEENIKIIALLFQLEILLFIELKQSGRSSGFLLNDFVQFFQEAVAHNFLLEISAIELSVEQNLIEFLQVGEREFFIEQLKANPPADECPTA